MADAQGPKKSMREQVEEYKRQQREAEEHARRKASAAERDKGADDATDDHDNDDPDETDWERDAKFDKLEGEVKEALDRGPNVGKIVGGVFTCVGFILLAVTAAIVWFTKQSAAREVEAPGVVVRNELRRHENISTNSRKSRGSSDLYHAVVEFPLADGTKKIVEMSSGRWPKRWEEGEAVTVRYDPQTPLDAHIKGDSTSGYFAAILTGILGLVFSAVGLVTWRVVGRV